MAGFQQAANAVVSAPGRISAQSTIVGQLKRDLAGEQATTKAYQTIANATTRIAKGETVSDKELNEIRTQFQDVPEANRKDLLNTMKGVVGLGKAYTSQHLKLTRRIGEEVATIKAGLQRKNMLKAMTGYSREELLAGGLEKYMQGVQEDLKEELKSGTTQTSR